MSYKGYQARVEFDAEDEIFFGRIAGINDIVSFGTTAEITATPVPEPTSLVLFGTGALGVLARMRRRKQQ